MMKTTLKKTETVAHDLRVLSKSYQMNTNMTGFRCVFFLEMLHSYALGKSSLSIKRINRFMLVAYNWHIISFSYFGSIFVTRELT